MIVIYVGQFLFHLFLTRHPIYIYIYLFMYIYITYIHLYIYIYTLFYLDYIYIIIMQPAFLCLLLFCAISVIGVTLCLPRFYLHMCRFLLERSQVRCDSLARQLDISQAVSKSHSLPVPCVPPPSSSSSVVVGVQHEESGGDAGGVGEERRVEEGESTGSSCTETDNTPTTPAASAPVTFEKTCVDEVLMCV